MQLSGVACLLPAILLPQAVKHVPVVLEGEIVLSGNDWDYPGVRAVTGLRHADPGDPFRSQLAEKPLVLAFRIENKEGIERGGVLHEREDVYQAVEPGAEKSVSGLLEPLDVVKETKKVLDFARIERAEGARGRSYRDEPFRSRGPVERYGENRCGGDNDDGRG